VTRARMRVFAFGALLLMLAPTLVACGGGGSTTTKTIKVGLVADEGGLNDQGFNQLANKGLEKAKTELGVQGDVKVSTKGADYEPNLTAYASQGFDPVIAVGFNMSPAVGKVSGDFPNTHFIIIDGQGTDTNFNDLKHTNVESLFFSEQDAGALVGVFAGMLEKKGASPKKSHVISAVGGKKIPPVDHFIAGYQWASKQEDSSLKVLYSYSDDFADSAKCRDIANGQIAKGSDIVFQVAGGCGLGALAAAGQKGVYSIGVDSDQKARDTSVIASAVKRVDVATFSAIKDFKEGNFKAGADVFTLKNDGVGIAAGNIAIPADIQTEIDKVTADIKSGAKTVPANPQPSDTV
jgi:basic membrane protein A and related proteins